MTREKTELTKQQLWLGMAFVLAAGLSVGYFVHSFHPVCDNVDDVVCETSYGYPFVSGIERENIYGVQFHPEKSHRFGMKLLKNFIELA